MSNACILGIGVGLPSGSQTLEEAGDDLSLTATQTKMFRRLFGLAALPYAPDEPLTTLLRAALDDLDARAPGLRDDLSLVLHCHTIPTIAPVAHSPLDGLDLRLRPDGERVSLAMSHCATGLSALALAAARLRDGETALVLIGEKAFHPRIRLIADTTIMGEGAVAVLVGRGPGLFSIEGVHTTHDGSCSVSRGHPGEEAELPASYAGFLSAHLRDALGRFGVGVADLALLAPHNVNTLSWRAAARELGLAPERLFLSNVARLGHCFGADPFINARDALDAGVVGGGDLVLATSVGMGATAASALLRVSPALPGRAPDPTRTPSFATEDTTR